MQNKRLIQIAVIGGGILLLIIIFSSRIFVTIDQGERGVVFRPLSGGINLKENPYTPGLHVIAPWNRMITYSIREKTYDAGTVSGQGGAADKKLNVLSSNGLDIGLQLTVRYRVMPDSIGYLYQKLGKNYKRKVIIPSVRSATRLVIGQYKPEELYSSEKQEIQTKIKNRLNSKLDKSYLNLVAINIRSIELPDKIANAIERKLAEEQKIQQKEYAKEKEKKEAERRKIEARGKAKANKILDQSLTKKVLKDKGIEATEKLAKSDNSKVIVIGGGGDGLPLILDSGK
ncbi:MAG: prohibitin family protein [Flavobacteriales bacterium]